MRRVAKIFAFVVLVPVVIALVTYLVMTLWNWLMPALFGLHVVTYWQALGLLVLAKIFFGGVRGARGGPPFRRHWRERMYARWEAMTPEERERFRQGMRARCGWPSPPAGEPKSS